MISVENLTKRFGDFVALRDVGFEVSAGEIFAFLGPNGAGKTTTLNILTTLTRPTNGTVRIDGIDAIQTPNEVRRRFGIVFQDPSLDRELSAYDNLELHGVLYHIPRRVRRERIRLLLESFELWGRHDELVSKFSGGMSRRLEVARALLHRPPILFLDEPTLGLDPQSRNHLWTLIRHLNRQDGITVFLTSHHMDEAERLADRVAILDAGRITACGSSQDLKRLTATESLEDAFLSLTGAAVREETLNPVEHMRNVARAWQR